MRRRLIVGNWKMHKTASEAAAFVRRLSELAPPTAGIEVVLAPPFTSLQAAAQAAAPSFPFTLAAQNLYWEDRGAFTGEVSAPMLADLGCRYVILGHSERRQLFGEQDEGIHKKVRAALRHGMRPMLCLGESLAERDAGQTESIVTGQLARCLEGVSKDDALLVTIAYEPVWAIGTGRAATPAQAAAVHETLRRTLASGWGSEAGQQVRILYGGSVTPENTAAFLASPQIDGALVGGACLDPQSFATICSLAQKLADSRER
ncbi:MAG: triose-phosphate isomerase [Nitrospira sp.]|nr:triose-phosphate isomerase [Nitrospira sp.]